MRRRFIAVGLFALLFALGWWAGRGRASGDLYARLDTFIEILHKVEENYVEPVEPEHLIRGAVHGMLRDLDPYAEFIDTRAQRDRAAAGAIHSGDADVGLAIGVRNNAWTVIAPLAGGPAERAGLRAGDLLLQVDGRSSASWTRAELGSKLRGPRGSRVRLNVAREGEDAPREIVVTRASLPRLAPPDSRMIEKSIGYVKLGAIGDSTALQLRALLRRLRGSGALALAFDLRGCTSGTVRQGADVAQLLLPRGALVTVTHGRGRGADQRLNAAEPSPVLDWPVAVVIDGTSAGAAEIVAGALQDHDRALLVGRTTFGLASAQSDFPLEGGNAAVRFTTAVQLTPSGRPIQRFPSQASDDEEAPDADSAATDSATRRAYLTHAGRKVLAGGGIRPDLEMADSASAPGTARPVAGDDPLLRRAVAVLRRAHAPRDVFATATVRGSGAAEERRR